MREKGKIMDKIHVMTIFGTRPEAIKMAPLVIELESRPQIKSSVCVTAQHREMLDQVLNLFNIVPKHDLDIMKESQSLSEITSRVLSGFENIIKIEKPDIVLVHGDTTTTFAGSLAAFYNKIMVGHVEAGLRTFNKYLPFPEELNRKLTGCLADIHFAPTPTSKRNLLNEGVRDSDIFITGNTAIDVMASTVDKSYRFENSILNDLDFKNRRVIFVTAHRRENWGKPLEDICMALRDIVQKYDDVEIVYPVHLNPVVSRTAGNILSDHKRVHLLSPFNIRESHNLMDRCYMALTDSGGLQEEAPHLGKPVLVLRDVTERPEAVEAGTLKVIGTERNRIVSEASILLEDKAEYSKMANSVNPFGDGKASKRIAEAILYKFNIVPQKPDEFGR